MTERNPKLEALDALAGDWVLGDPESPVGRTSFSWLEGGRFLVQRWTVEIPEVGGFGGEFPFFWVSHRGRGAQSGVHVAFTAKDRPMVDAFHAAALEAGGTDNGGPGVREIYHPAYYGAFVLDPDGNNVEAVCHRPE